MCFYTKTLSLSLSCPLFPSFASFLVADDIPPLSSFRLCSLLSGLLLLYHLESLPASLSSGCSFIHLVATYCAIPRDYLSDTPLLRAMGFLVSQHGQLGAIPPPPFSERFPLGEHAKWRCDPPPLERGISAILA